MVAVSPQNVKSLKKKIKNKHTSERKNKPVKTFSESDLITPISIENMKAKQKNFDKKLKRGSKRDAIDVKTDGSQSEIPRSHRKRKPKGANGKTKLATSTIILKNLPPTIDYTKLKAVVPTATRLELYKKNAKRHAFAKFATAAECSSVAAKLKNVKLGDYQIHVAFASRPSSHHSRTTNTSDASAETTLHLSNLPFKITQKRLEEEFPTASKVVMNMGSNGRFRGSCLLQFESADDCRIVQEACRGRRLDGRLIRCAQGAGFTPREPVIRPKQTNQQFFGVKVKGVPNHLSKDELRSVFDKKELSSIVCFVDNTETTMTVLYKFKSGAAQKSALIKFNKETVFGLKLYARRWAPPSRRRGSKLVPDQSSAEQKVPSNVQPKNSSSKPKTKKRLLTEVDQEPSDMNETGITDESFISQTKSKRKKHHETHDSNKSMTYDLGNGDDSLVSETKPKKKKHLDVHDGNESTTDYFEITDDSLVSETKSKKKKHLEVHDENESTTDYFETPQSVLHSSKDEHSTSDLFSISKSPNRNSGASPQLHKSLKKRKSLTT